MICWPGYLQWWCGRVWRVILGRVVLRKVWVVLWRVWKLGTVILERV
jgi:hypothetical protein